MEAPEPCSPGTEEVELRECIEELTYFTLRSHLTGANHLLLSTHFCSTLLDSGDYKKLALSLHDCISRGGFRVDDGEEEKRIGEWSQLVQEEGSVLANVYKSVNFQLHVQEPYFTQLKDGVKAVEGRCAAGDYNRIRPGALVLVNKCLVLEVQDVQRYASFYEMLKEEGLDRVLPGVSTIDEAVAVYRKFYTEGKEKSNGVLGICVAISASQPYISLARILSGLGDRGILMLMHPPASVLIDFPMMLNDYFGTWHLVRTQGSHCLARPTPPPPPPPPRPAQPSSSRYKFGK